MSREWNVIDKDGQIYTYDININTNYNQVAEQRESCKSAYTQLAEFLYKATVEV